MKYKLIKSFPNSPEVSDVLDFTNNDIVIDNNQRCWAIEDCIDYPEFWEQVKIPKFKVGDIVVTNTEFVFKIIGIEGLNLYYQEKLEWKYWDNDGSCKLASNEEILKYYEQQGWVKGAKFKIHNKIETLEKVVCILDCVQAHSLQYADAICNCELIKEPNYPKSWEELKLTRFSNNVHTIDLAVNRVDNKDLFATEKQAQSTLAYAQLSQLHAKFIEIYNQENNCDWKPNWNNHFGKNWVVYRFQNHLSIICRDSDYYHLAFPTEELAKLFLEYHEDLLMTYFELDNA